MSAVICDESIHFTGHYVVINTRNFWPGLLILHLYNVSCKSNCNPIYVLRHNVQKAQTNMSWFAAFFVSGLKRPVDRAGHTNICAVRLPIVMTNNFPRSAQTHKGHAYSTQAGKVAMIIIIIMVRILPPWTFPKGQQWISVSHEGLSTPITT